MQELTQHYNDNNDVPIVGITLKNLQTQKLGRNYVYYEKIDSTQKEIWRRIENNSIIDGMLIRADKQTSGIGTHGRVWKTKENNIAFSFYMKTSCDISKIDGITIKIAEIIIKVIKIMYGIKLEIKPPNDIYVNGKKLGGILTQTKLIGESVKFLVVGIGMNNSQTDFDEDLKNIATSFKKEFALQIDVEKFIVRFCDEFESMLFELLEAE